MPENTFCYGSYINILYTKNKENSLRYIHAESILNNF